jgi:hypothetical protein
MRVFGHLAIKNHLVTEGKQMKLTITTPSRNDFGVIVNSEELYKTKQLIFTVNTTDSDLHELTKSRVDENAE